MRKIVLLSACLIYSCAVFSQDFEWTESRGFQIHELAQLSDGSVFLASDDDHGGSGFFVRRPDGSQLEDVFNFNFSTHYEITETADGGYLFAFHALECDIFISGIVKMDGDWVYQWDWVNFEGESPQAAPFSNGDILHTEGTKLFRRTAQGDFVWDLEVNQEIFDLATGPGDFIYVALENGIFKLDENGIDLDIMTDDMPVWKVIAGPTGKVAALTAAGVQVFDADLELLATQPFGGLQFVNDFDFDGEKIAVLLGHDTSAFSVEVKIFDASLTETNSFNLPDEIDFREIVLHGNEVLLAGREFYGMGETASVVKAFAFDGSTADYGSDAALTSATIGEVGIKYLPFGVDALLLPAVQVTLENAGTDNLQAVTIAMRGPETTFGFCFWEQFFTEKFTGLNLAPGSSVTLTLDTIEVLFYDDFPPPTEFCFFAYLPDDRTDQQHADNFACDGFIVAAGEWPSANLELEIYPNPTAGQLTVRLPEALPADAEITLRNSYGQVVQRSVFSKNEKAKTLDVSRLASGVYFLEMKMESGFGVKKFVKR